MVKNTFRAIAVIAALTAVPAVAAGAPGDLDGPIAGFTSAYGPQVVLERDAEDASVTFAGRFSAPAPAAAPDLAALAFLDAWAPLWGFDPVLVLGDAEVRRISGLTFVRLAQEHAGVPVEGGVVTVTLGADGAIHQVASSVSMPDAWAAPEPSVGSAQAMGIAEAHSGTLQATGSARLTYLPSSGGTAPLAWAVRCRTFASPEAPDVYVDAHTGSILWIRDTNVYADGNIFDPNPVLDTTGPHRVELPNLTSASTLSGTYARSASCEPGSGWDLCSSMTSHAVPDGDGHYLYDPDEPSITDGFAEVMAYYHMDKINTYMEDTYGHVHRCDGHRWMDVHVNMDYENAWYGDQDEDGCRDVTIGQGTSDFAYDAAILYHEFGHGINHDYSQFRWRFDDLGPDNSPQGLDEAFADYWAATVTGEPVIGSYASLGTIGELGIRDLRDFASCPDDIFGEGHYDSPMLSSALWEIREALGASKSDQLMLAVLASLSDRPDFSEAGSALLSQAAALESAGVLDASDVTAVDAAVTAHTLVGCERIVFMEDGDTHLFISMGYGGWETAAGVQFAIYAPPGTTRLTAAITDASGGMGTYGVYVNRNTPVHFTFAGWEMSIDDYDEVYSGSPDRVTYTEWSDPPIQPDTTYYFTYTQNADAMYLGVEAIVTVVEPPEDSGTDAVEDPIEDGPADGPADVPVETEDDPTEEDPVPDPDASVDAPEDASPDAGEIETTGGCGCAIAH